MTLLKPIYQTFAYVDNFVSQNGGILKVNRFFYRIGENGKKFSMKNLSRLDKKLKSIFGNSEFKVCYIMLNIYILNDFEDLENLGTNALLFKELENYLRNSKPFYLGFRFYDSEWNPILNIHAHCEVNYLL